MFKDIKFQSERLITQPLCNEDAASLFKIYSDHEAMKYRGSPPMKSMDEAYHMIETQSITNSQTLKLRLAIRTKADNELIGTLLLSKEEKNSPICEIGFSFAKEHWRKGYGQETLKMVEAQLGNFEKTETIKAWCIKENIASVSIFEKAGYTKVAQQKYPQSHLLMKRITHPTG